jgi:hypothetical protein
MLILRPTHLHWLNADVEDSADLCAHSPVELTIGGVTLVKGLRTFWREWERRRAAAMALS